MKIIIFGASGRTGHYLTRQVLSTGNQVTAFVRNPSRLYVKHENLKVWNGDILSNEEVGQAMVGQEAVLFALGETRTTAPTTMLSDAIKTIIQAMNLQKIKRILSVGNAGILQETETALICQNPTYPQNYNYIIDDHLRVFEAFKKCEMEWTIVAPPTLIDAPETKLYRLLANYLPPNGRQINTGDIAHFIMNELTAKQFVNQRVGIAY